MKKIAILLSLVTFVLITACKTTIPLRNYNNQVLPSIYKSAEGRSLDDVERAIVQAAIANGWTTQTTKPGELLATLDLRQHQLVVTITFDKKEFSVKYKSSVNLKYRNQKNYGKRIHRQYHNWVSNLIRSINSYSIAK